MAKDKCPVFRHPRKYLKRRRSTVLFFPKHWAEASALVRCLQMTSDVDTVLDVPSGPGRLFDLWRRMGFRVFAADLSEEMVAAAERKMKELGLDGGVRRSDIFSDPSPAPEETDLVACVRFAYYFSRGKRQELLRILGGLSRRYVLVQYKTRETLRGMRSLRNGLKKAKDKPEYSIKEFCSSAEIIEEVREAGLVPLRVVPIAEFSDRIFVLAEKPQGGAASRPEPIVDRTLARTISGWFGIGRP